MHGVAPVARLPPRGRRLDAHAPPAGAAAGRRLRDARAGRAAARRRQADCAPGARRARITFYGHEAVGAEIAVAICQRLRRSRETWERVDYLVRNHLRLVQAPQMRLATLKKMLARGRLRRAAAAGAPRCARLQRRPHATSLFCERRRAELGRRGPAAAAAARAAPTCWRWATRPVRASARSCARSRTRSSRVTSTTPAAAAAFVRTRYPARRLTRPRRAGTRRGGARRSRSRRAGPRQLLLGERRPGDVEVRPRHAVDELGEEERADDRAGVAADVLQVGDRALQIVAILAHQRQLPEPLAAGPARCQQRDRRAPGRCPGRKRSSVPERDPRGAGERGEVDDGVRAASRAASDERVGEDQPALGVGVENLHRLAVARTGSRRRASAHARRAGSRSQARRPSPRSGSPRAAATDTACSAAAPPAMSYFMVSIDFAGLSERPPESKVMPLPTIAIRRRAPPRAGSWRRMTKRGSSRAAARDREAAGQPFLRHAVRPPHLGPQTGRRLGEAAARRARRSAAWRRTPARSRGRERRRPRQRCWRRACSERVWSTAGDGMPSLTHRQALRPAGRDARSDSARSDSRRAGSPGPAVRLRRRVGSTEPRYAATRRVPEPLGLAPTSCAGAQPRGGAWLAAEPDECDRHPVALDAASSSSARPRNSATWARRSIALARARPSGLHRGGQAALGERARGRDRRGPADRHAAHAGTAGSAGPSEGLPGEIEHDGSSGGIHRDALDQSQPGGQGEHAEHERPSR